MQSLWKKNKTTKLAEKWTCSVPTVHNPAVDQISGNFQTYFLVCLECDQGSQAIYLFISHAVIMCSKCHILKR